MEIPWLEINDSNSLLYNRNPLNNFKIISQDKRAVRLVGFENSKVIGSLYFQTKIFFLFLKGEYWLYSGKQKDR